jgi:hypothetical protein
MIKTILQADLFIQAGVGTPEQSNSIIQALYNYKDMLPPTHQSNEGCWRVTNPKLDIDWLWETVMNLYKEAQNRYSINSDELEIFFWANINSPMSRNVFHSHKDAIMSGVYYLQATSTGDLRFSNPANMLCDCNEKSPFTEDSIFKPADRDLIMWPSWVPHEVETNFSIVDRVNIAFDIIDKR